MIEVQTTLATEDEASSGFRVSTGSRLRDARRQEMQTLKKAHGIFSHHCAGGGDWMALSMPECTAALAGYDLTEEEKTDAVALMAGYCRLLDEANMIEQGHRTEYDAVKALVARLSANSRDERRAEITTEPRALNP